MPPCLLRAELRHPPRPVLARFELALASKRESGTSLVEFRCGTKGALLTVPAADGLEVDAFVPDQKPAGWVNGFRNL
jgi:hypothetical protein